MFFYYWFCSILFNIYNNFKKVHVWFRFQFRLQEQRNRVFATNLNFLNPISLQPDSVYLRYFKLINIIYLLILYMPYAYLSQQMIFSQWNWVLATNLYFNLYIFATWLCKPFWYRDKKISLWEELSFFSKLYLEPHAPLTL